MASGQVLFHRYFYSSSFIRRPMEIVAMACVTLAAKTEEDARRIRDVINVFHHIKQIRSGKYVSTDLWKEEIAGYIRSRTSSRTIHPLLIDQVYIDRKSEVIKAERRLLKELGFCVYVKHPHKVWNLSSLCSCRIEIFLYVVDDYHLSESPGKRTWKGSCSNSLVSEADESSQNWRSPLSAKTHL